MRINRTCAALLLLTLLLGAALTLPARAESGTGAFRYEHDPRLNPKAMADIVADPAAVYGFAPAADGSLKSYAAFDWSDPALVNGESGRLARIAYHESIQEMYAMLEAMEREGKSVEEIARAVSAKRNEIRLAASAGDPEALAAAKKRNLEKYGHEDGPQPDELYAQYGSWETVLEKAFSTNSGMDACLGLYDDYYALYVAAGQVEDERTAPASREYAAAAFAQAAGLPPCEAADALDGFRDAGQVSACYARELAAAVSAGVLRGCGDNTLRAHSTITRVEAMALLSRCLPETDENEPGISFADVPAWAERDVARLAKAGIVRGYGGALLGADDLLTVEQVKTLVERLHTIR